MKRLLIAITLSCVLSSTAWAGEMPGTGKSVTGQLPSVGSTSTTGDTSAVPPPPVPGEMPGVGGATSSETGSIVTTVLLTIITLIGR